MDQDYSKTFDLDDIIDSRYEVLVFFWKSLHILQSVSLIRAS